jgi:hypothetical protein
MLPDGPGFAEAFARVITLTQCRCRGYQPTGRCLTGRNQVDHSMGRRNDGPRPRYPTKHARKLARAVASAGGTVELTANGHMRITGPGGVAIVGAHTAIWRAEKNTVAAIRKYAGLEIRL